MVVETPIPASSIRAATPEESEAWIDEWIKDIAIHFQEFAPNALAYAEALCLMGYTTKSSLNLLHDDDRRDALQELQDGLGLNRGMAKRLLNEALALHPRNQLVHGTSSSVTSAGSTPAIPVAPFTDKLNAARMCTEPELNRYLDTLLCHVHGQSDILGPLLEQFCVDPGMNDTDFEALQVQIPAWHNRQLAALVKQSLSHDMNLVLTAKRPRGATGLELLRDVAAHHHGPIAVKYKLKEAADHCYNKVQPVHDRCDLRVRLTEHLRYVKYLADADQPLGDAMLVESLRTLVEELQLTNEIETATNILEACGTVWTSTHLLEILNRRANEWIFLQKSSCKQTAAAASHSIFQIFTFT
jgi:hypothetical protein